MSKYGKTLAEIIDVVLFLIPFLLLYRLYIFLVLGTVVLLNKAPLLESWFLLAPAFALPVLVLIFVFRAVKRRSGERLRMNILEDAFRYGTGSVRLRYYLGALVVSAVLVFAVIRGSGAVFASYADAEGKRLQDSGMSLEPYSYYPRIKYDDKDNAAPHIEASFKKLVPGAVDDVEELWAAILKNGYGSGDGERIKRLYRANSGAVAAFGEGVGRKKLLWEEVSGKDPAEFLLRRYPDFKAIRTIIRLEILEGVRLSSFGDWTGARKRMAMAVVFARLLEQDPGIFGARMRDAVIRMLLDGAVTAVKAARGRDVAQEFETFMFDDVAALKLDAAPAIMFEMAALDAMLRYAFFKNKPCGGVKWFLWPQNVIYCDFAGWDDYVSLKGFRFFLAEARERDVVKRTHLAAETDMFFKDRAHMPALRASMFVILASMGDREYRKHIARIQGTEVKKDMAGLLFAAVKYKRKHGKYPETLDKLAPEYMAVIPKNPLKNAPYVYKTSGEYMEITAEPDDSADKLITVSIGKKPERRQ